MHRISVAVAAAACVATVQLGLNGGASPAGRDDALKLQKRAEVLNLIQAHMHVAEPGGPPRLGDAHCGG